MLLHVRSIAVGVAVLCFFGVGIVGTLTGLTPYICCKRALLGTTVGYLTAGAAVRAVNAIVTQAMIDSRIGKSKEIAGDSQD